MKTTDLSLARIIARLCAICLEKAQFRFYIDISREEGKYGLLYKRKRVGPDKGREAWHSMRCFSPNREEVKVGLPSVGAYLSKCRESASLFKTGGAPS